MKGVELNRAELRYASICRAGNSILTSCDVLLFIQNHQDIVH